MKEHVDQTSKYWLSPGIDVPTKSDSARVLSKPRPLQGLYYDKEKGDAAFIPSDDFMSMPPQARIDMIDDILADLDRTRTHALVAQFRACEETLKSTRFPRQIAAFRNTCEMLGIYVPENLESLLTVDQAFRSEAL